MDEQETSEFDLESIKSYPFAERKIQVEIGQYTILQNETSPTPSPRQKALTTFISPHGMEIQGTKDYPTGTLLKISVCLPDYWNRKKKFVEYNRVDVPNTFKVLGKVVGSQDMGKRGKKKLILVQTLNIDEIDEQVLKDFLEEGKSP